MTPAELELAERFVAAVEWIAHCMSRQTIRQAPQGPKEHTYYMQGAPQPEPPNAKEPQRRRS